MRLRKEKEEEEEEKEEEDNLNAGFQQEAKKALSYFVGRERRRKKGRKEGKKEGSTSSGTDGTGTAQIFLNHMYCLLVHLCLREVSKTAQLEGGTDRWIEEKTEKKCSRILQNIDS